MLDGALEHSSAFCLSFSASSSSETPSKTFPGSTSLSASSSAQISTRLTSWLHRSKPTADNNNIHRFITVIFGTNPLQRSSNFMLFRRPHIRPSTHASPLTRTHQLFGGGKPPCQRNPGMFEEHGAASCQLILHAKTRETPEQDSFSSSALFQLSSSYRSTVDWKSKHLVHLFQACSNLLSYRRHLHVVTCCPVVAAA